MESEVFPNECRDSLMHDHYSLWKFKKFCLTLPSVKTIVFSPIPNFDVNFYFEIWYKEFLSDNDFDENAYTFKICLVKSCGVNIPPYLKMKINVSINYDLDEKIFREYKQDNISVETMSRLTIANEMFKQMLYENGRYKTAPNAFQRDFSLTCNLVFYDHLSTPAAYYKERRSLKNMKQFANDFTCLYQLSPSSIPEAAHQLNDVEIKIGNETFLAHKVVLASHSPVFLKMFNHDFLESKTSVINISDFSAETFRDFLKYLYSGEIEYPCELAWPTVKELYALADKYDVRTLKRECAEISSTFLSVDVVCEILRMAYDYGDDYLKFEGKKFAFMNIKELLPTSGWKEMIRHNPLIGYEVMSKYAPKLD